MSRPVAPSPEIFTLPVCEALHPDALPHLENLDREALLRLLKQRERNWKDCLHRYRLALYAAYDVVFASDLVQKNFIAPENRWRQLLGRAQPQTFSEALATGRSLCHPEDTSRFDATFAPERLEHPKGQEGAHLSLEYRSRVDGEWKWLSCTLIPVSDDKGVVVRILGVIKDLDKQKSREETLLRQSAYDDLTRLCNRREGMARVRQLLETHDIVAFAMLDLDNFKAVNDKRGHHCGDLLLRDVASVLEREAPENAVVARLGGDEFLVAFPCVDEVLACPALERLTCASLQWEGASEDDVTVTVSLGAAFSPRHGVTFQALYENADIALRQAKNFGKNTWCVAPSDQPPAATQPQESVSWRQDVHDPDLLSGDMVYVVDPRTYALLYVNEAGEMLPGLAWRDRSEARCFQLLHGLEAPCPFCPNATLRPDDARFWRCESSYHQRRFLVRSQRLRRNNTEVCRHVITDITNQKQADALLRNAMASKNVLFSCSRRLLSALNGDDAVNDVLARMGRFYGADLVCLAHFLQNAERPDHLLEWRREGLSPQPGSLQNMPMGKFPRLREALDRATPEHLDALSGDDADAVSFRKALDLRRAHLACLAPLGPYRGFLCVGNATRHLGDMTLLNGLSLFLSSELEKRALLRQRTYDDFHDPHTGLPNRASFEHFVRSPLIVRTPSLGLAVADINALKNINKIHGREMGDVLIQQTSKTLRDCFPQGRIYRMDGDEFVVLGPGASEQTFSSHAQRARRMLEDVGCGVALGFGWNEHPVDADALYNFAHERMLWQKRRFYSREKTN